MDSEAASGMPGSRNAMPFHLLLSFAFSVWIAIAGPISATTAQPAAAASAVDGGAEESQRSNATSVSERSNSGPSITSESAPPVPASQTDSTDDDHPAYHSAESSTNPWLYIVIGMLVVTGVLLYVDPRIF